MKKYIKSKKTAVRAGYNAGSGIQASARSRKRPIKATADGHDPWAMIEAQKPVIIKRWSTEDYTGEPNTSWDWIFDSVLEDFKLYADDEASADETGARLLDKFIEGDFDEIDMLDAFNDFIMWRDINYYDVAE